MISHPEKSEMRKTHAPLSSVLSFFLFTNCPRAAECVSYAREIPCALCPALSTRRCALPPPFCKILQRWGRVCPRPSPSLGCPFYLFITEGGGRRAEGEGVGMYRFASRTPAVILSFFLSTSLFFSITIFRGKLRGNKSSNFGR